MKHCVVYLKNGTVLDFDKKAKSAGAVEKNSGLMGFYTYQMNLVAIVPIENILYVTIEGG